MADPVLVPDLLRVRAAAEPDRVALAVAGGGSVTYGDWERRSTALARGLLADGAVRGERVGLYLENTDWVEYGIGYLGAIKAGAVAVPLSGRFTGPELGSVLARTGIGRLVGAGRGPGPTAAARHLTVAGLERAGMGRTDPLPALDPGDVVEVLYTSGTTGLPKGVACTHHHVVCPLVEPSDWPPRVWRDCAGGVYLHANAVSTAAGQLRLLDSLGPDRMTVLALPVFDAERFCALVAEYRAVVVQLVPTMATAILAGAHRTHDLSSVRVVSLGCAPLPPAVLPDLAAAFGNATLINLYELSETRSVGTAMIHGGTRAGSVGRPRGRTEVRIVDGSGHDRPTGSPGEVWMRWHGLPPQHYFGDEAATAQVFVDGWSRTGDVGYLDVDGYLHLTDRLKDVIIRGGLNVSSVEVENALREHPAVTDAAVFGVPDPAQGEAVAAAVVLSGQVPVAGLTGFLRDRLAGHKVPQHVHVVDELPRNRSGKVLKNALRERFAAPATQAPPAEDATAIDAGAFDAGAFGGERQAEVARVLAGIWAEVLGQPVGRPGDHFLDLGGDSLLATRVCSRVRSSLGAELAVMDVFDHRTLAELSALLADRIESASSTPAPAPIPVRPRPAAVRR